MKSSKKPTDLCMLVSISLSAFCVYVSVCSCVCVLEMQVMFFYLYLFLFYLTYDRIGKLFISVSIFVNPLLHFTESFLLLLYSYVSFTQLTILQNETDVFLILVIGLLYISFKMSMHSST